jgi:hypothetical protein
MQGRRTLVALATLAAAGASLDATDARAQAAPAMGDASAAPACSEQGVQRVAVMVPPGQTTAELRALLAGGSLFPPGTEAVILQPGQIAPLRDARAFDEQLRLTLDRLLRNDIMISGTVSALLVLDASGAVREVHPNSGNRDVDRSLVATWRHALFEPYVHEGCRVPAWIHVPLSFASDWSASRRQTEVRAGPPPR